MSISNTEEPLEYENLKNIFFKHTCSNKQSKISSVDMKKESITFNCRGRRRKRLKKKGQIFQEITSYRIDHFDLSGTSCLTGLPVHYLAWLLFKYSCIFWVIFTFIILDRKILPSNLCFISLFQDFT